MRFENWDEAGEVLLENVSGVGEATLQSLREEMGVQTFEFGCAEAGKHGQTERLELADGVGPSLALRIGEYVVRHHPHK